MPKKILIFGTYPILNPQHGGQQRVSAVVNAYRKHGLKVKYVGIFLRNYYPDSNDCDIALEPASGTQTLAEAYTTDVSVGMRIYSDTDVRNRIQNIISDFKPDVIELEQFFPYYGLQKILAAMQWNGALVYNSQNIEAQLKQDILSNAGLSSAEIKKIVNDIEQTELELVKAANLVLACTNSDVDYYRSNGAKRVVLARNGIQKRTKINDNLNKWKNKFAKDGVTKPVLFVGSAHPPNLNGFINLLGFGAGCLPADSKLYLLGGISDLVAQKLTDQPNYISATFTLRAEFVGRVSEADLASLLMLANTIILPITEGGGSNLKTAEAILSGAKIVASSHAFRSYEDYLALPNISIADNKKMFRQSLHDSVVNDKQPRTKSQIKLSQKVIWDNVLHEMVKEVDSL